jgi:hypothetical protein
MAKEHDEWLRGFGLDPDKYLINPDAGAPEAKGAGAEAIEAKISAGLDELDAQGKRLHQAGIEARFLEKQAADLRGQFVALTKPGRTPAKAQLEALEKTVLAAVAAAGHDSQAQLASATKGSSKATHDLRDGAAEQIKQLADADLKKALQARLDALDRDLAAADKLTDPAKQKTALEATDAAARALLKDANDGLAGAAATPKDKEAAAMALQQVYRTALQDKFGIVVDDPAKTTKTTHLEKTYAALEKVPVDNVVQSKLTNLAFAKGAGAYGVYKDNMIIVGQFGKDSGVWPYQEPEPDKHKGKEDRDKLKAERMSAVVLHELGHSVDTRWGVMKHPDRKACGGWGSSNAAAVAGLLTAELLGGAGHELAPFHSGVQEAILGVITTNRANVPIEVATDPKLAPILQAFLGRCRSLRYDKDPWNRPWAIGGGDRAYHESYAGTWVSYSLSARNGGMTVSPYQWRAAGEWFAELYAFTHVQQRKAPEAVDKDAAFYMFGGGA